MNTVKVVLIALFLLPIIVSTAAVIVGFIRFVARPQSCLDRRRPVGMSDDELACQRAMRKYPWVDELVKEERGLTAEQWDELYEETLRRNRPGGPWTKL